MLPATPHWGFFLAAFLAVLWKCSESATCLDENGETVDWWFIYKVNDGTNYAYFEEGSPAGFKVVSGKTLSGGSNSALERTLQQVYSNESSLNLAAYNDEKPDSDSSESSYGHTKGVLAFDARGVGFWLIHSVPKFPDLSLDSYDFTASDVYGQTFLCIALASSGQLDLISEQLRYEKPYVYAKAETDSSSVPNFEELLAKQWLSGESVQKVTSSQGTQFTHFARSGDADTDIMEDMISPHYQLHFVWETWRRSPEEDSYCPPEYAWMELNVDNVEFADGTAFRETQDHSKVGASYENDSIACVGGLNRMTSQNERGGGYACFPQRALWQSLTTAFVNVSYCSS